MTGNEETLFSNVSFPVAPATCVALTLFIFLELKSGTFEARLLLLSFLFWESLLLLGHFIRMLSKSSLNHYSLNWPYLIAVSPDHEM